MLLTIRRISFIIIIHIFSYLSIHAVEQNSKESLRNNEINQSIEINPLSLATICASSIGIGLVYEISYQKVSFRLFNGIAFFPDQNYYNEGELILGMSHLDFRWFPFQQAPIGFYIGGGAGICGLCFKGMISGTSSTSTSIHPLALGTIGYKFQLSKKGSIRMIFDLGAEALFMFPGTIEFKGNTNYSGYSDATYLLIVPSMTLGIYF